MPVDMPPSIVAAKPAAHVRATMTRAVTGKAPTSGVPYKRIKLQYLPDDRVFIPYIKYMRLPTSGWWVTVPGFFMPPSGHSYDFEPWARSDNDTSLHISCAGRRRVDDAPITEILKKEPHELSQSERELIEPGMNKSDKVYTRFLDGKTVLVQEFCLNNENNYQVEFNANSKGSKIVVPATITFRAKPASYKLHIKRVKASLDTIKWKDIEMSGAD
ncbi:MAG: hypothetical protein IPP57_16540 [Candidatus Obscuribacter sp.]|jgi:hypothetical protein|nr:hypothetical protein [Candidatus Obscuribacter sp.]MBK9205337.1 hypothetical protein [Candidatus Obscuribacter sp.]MBK9622667.1 hypothetical protein [Candidatus Obscuribacter sp.]MBK9772402.1 hypothetical protein [Candidatus Obscuribacter sp.]